jgi:hypothetical protein
VCGWCVLKWSGGEVSYSQITIGHGLFVEHKAFHSEHDQVFSDGFHCSSHGKLSVDVSGQRSVADRWVGVTTRCDHSTWVHPWTSHPKMMISRFWFQQFIYTYKRIERYNIHIHILSHSFNNIIFFTSPFIISSVLLSLMFYDWDKKFVFSTQLQNGKNNSYLGYFFFCFAVLLLLLVLFSDHCSGFVWIMSRVQKSIIYCA